MQTLPTFQEQYNKIIDAYFKDEIKPLDAHFCFCGTLCENSNNWYGAARYFHLDYMFYKGSEYLRMEKSLIDTMSDFERLKGQHFVREDHPIYEESLFIGMCAALEVLKQIHIERGEVIDEIKPAFAKRTLNPNQPIV